MLPPRILSDLPTAPRADITIPTGHRRQPRLGPRPRGRGVAGIQMQASLPEKSKLLSDCHAASVTAKHQIVNQSKPGGSGLNSEALATQQSLS